MRSVPEAARIKVETRGSWAERAAAAEAAGTVAHASALLNRAVGGHLGRLAEVLGDMADETGPRLAIDRVEASIRLREVRVQLAAAALLLLQAEQAIAGRRAAA